MSTVDVVKDIHQVRLTRSLLCKTLEGVATTTCLLCLLVRAIMIAAELSGDCFVTLKHETTLPPANLVCGTCAEQSRCCIWWVSSFLIRDLQASEAIDAFMWLIRSRSSLHALRR